MLLRRPTGHVIVRPVQEHAADSELSGVYREVKAALRVPWVGVIVQAVAHYRPFFFEAWRQFRPSAETEDFERTANEVRTLAWNGVSSLGIASQRPLLTRMGYGQRELAQIASTLNVFEYGNPKYLIFATAIAQALVEERPGAAASHPVGHRTAAPDRIEPAGGAPVMVEEHHAFGDLSELYGDIKTTLDLPFVNSDYKALARWPSYLKVAWQHLKPALNDPAYARLRREIHDRAVRAANDLPYAYALDVHGAIALGMSTTEIDELRRTICLFQWLLSGLVLNVAHFKRALVELGGD